jgi:replicative DNA helicase
VKEKRAPALHDLRESGSIEQNGDCVQFVWRPEMLPNNRDREDLRGQAELIVAKQRDGPIATIKLSFLANLVKFENAIEDLPEYEPPQRRFDHDD